MSDFWNGIDGRTALQNDLAYRQSGVVRSIPMNDNRDKQRVTTESRNARTARPTLSWRAFCVTMASLAILFITFITILLMMGH